MGISLLLVGLVACLAALIHVVYLVHHLEPPYRMTLRPVDGQAVVQFARPRPRLVSPEFPVNLPSASPQMVVLRSGDVPIPGCVVEFYDTTLLPGRFQLRIGGVLFDVMARGIEVDGKEVDWKPLEADPARPETRPAPATLP